MNCIVTKHDLRQWRQSGRIDILISSREIPIFRRQNAWFFSRFFQAHVSSKMRTDLAYEGRMTIAPRRAP
jgi:hypothetical protein